MSDRYALERLITPLIEQQDKHKREIERLRTRPRTLVPWVNVQNFGARGDGTTDDTAAIQAAIDAAKTQGFTSYLGAVVYFPPGRYLISSPIVLPRTGLTPTNVVWLVGANIRSTVIVGSSGFPTNRALIEWAATTARTWHQRIENFTFRLPEVVGARAIHYKRNGSGTTVADYNTERAQIALQNLVIEGHNDYHSSLIKLEGQIFYSDIRNVWGDPSRVLINPTYDTVTLETESTRPSDVTAATFPANDGTGLSYSRIDGLHGGLRRGGYCRVFSGRMFRVVWHNGFGQAGTNSPTFDFIDCSSCDISGIAGEGQGEPAQIKLTRCYNLHLHDFGLGTPDAVYSAWAASTAYVVGDRRIPTTLAGGGIAVQNKVYEVTVAGTSDATEPAWPSSGTIVDGGVTWTTIGDAVGDGLVLVDSHSCTIRNRMSINGHIPFSHRGTTALSIDSATTHTTVTGFNVQPRTDNDVTREYEDLSAVTSRNTIQGVNTRNDTAYTSPRLGVSTSLNFPSVAAGGTAELTITVPGARAGDAVALAAPASMNSGFMWAGRVSADDTVTVRIHNTTGGAVDPSANTWGVQVIKL